MTGIGFITALIINSAIDKKDIHSEDKNIEQTITQIQSADSFPEIPIDVVSGQKKMPFVPQRAFDIHLKYQHHLFNLSPHSVHYLCHKSGQSIPSNNSIHSLNYWENDSDVLIRVNHSLALSLGLAR